MNRIHMQRLKSKQSAQARAAQAIESGNLEEFQAVLQEVSASNGGKNLPESHWINQAVSEEQQQTFLVFAIEQVEDPQFTRELIRAGADVNLYDVESDQAPLHVAVLANSPLKTDILLANGADVNVTIGQSGQSALHLAAENGYDEVVKVLLLRQEINVNAEDNYGGCTPLFLATTNKHERCALLLIQHGANLNWKQDDDGPTLMELIQQNLPHLDLSSATASAPPKSIRTVEQLNNMMVNNNLFSFKFSLRYFDLDTLSTACIGDMTLLQRACSQGLHEYVQLLLDAGVDSGYGRVKPVLLAAARGHHEVLREMKKWTSRVVSNGAPMAKWRNNEAGTGKGSVVRFDVWTNDSMETVLHLILKKGQLRSQQAKGTKMSLLSGEDGHDDDDAIQRRYGDCLKVLLDDLTCEDFAKQIRLIVNKKDKMGNTPLHFATTSGWSQGVVRQLLDLGANIGVRNWRDEIPLSRISPETLSDFLDTECLQSKEHFDPLASDEDTEITFYYAFLAPPVSEDQLAKWDPEKQAELEREALPETNCVWYLSQSPQHRHLVTHPVIRSFLWLKWQRIRRFFNLNLRFYILFVVTLTWYIFARFAGHSWNDRHVVMNEADNFTERPAFCSDITYNELGQRFGFWYVVFVLHCLLQCSLIIRDWLADSEEYCCNYSSCCAAWVEVFTICTMAMTIWGASGILWLGLTFLLGLMASRELFQMLSSCKRYFMSVENWIELGIIALVVILVYVDEEHLGSDSSNGCHVKRCLAAIAILLSWAELITLVGRHPRLALYNKYVTMFYKVLTSFFSFLLWYAFFLAAFGLGFYIMLHNDIADGSKEESEYAFFNSPWLSLVKTSTMFVGEIEFADIPVDRASSPVAVLGYLFLLAFVFLIVVVLMNLLNGLAVSDTGLIEREAEIIGHVTRAETISYAESVLLGDPFDFFANWNGSSASLAKRSQVPSCGLLSFIYTVLPFFRSVAQKMTGATGILLFYSLLPEKQVVFPLQLSVADHIDGGCCCFEPRCGRRTKFFARRIRNDAEGKEIMEAAKRIILQRQKKRPDLSDMVQQMLQQQQTLNKIIMEQQKDLSELRRLLLSSHPTTDNYQASSHGH